MLVKSVPMKEGEKVDVIFEGEKESFSYQVPKDYRGVIHFIVDLFPAKQKVIFVPQSSHPKF